jgi:hypothetical protein
MKKLLLTLMTIIMSCYSYSQFWQVTDYVGAFPITDNTSATDWGYGWSNFDPENTNYPNTTSILSQDVTSNTTLSGVILLQNKVYVKNGATLTILPGTIIRGDLSTQGTLIITKGSNIIAEGTQNQPIIFTSNESVGNRAEGDWGGLVILGSAINNQPGGVANIEGLAPSSDTEFGGTNDNDNSGILKYVRVEFGGIPLQPNKEINGVTFGSVGDQTLVDYVQVSFSGDDSFEWFGGTVDCKHLISYKSTDDDFDTDFGYRGRVQFGLIIRDNIMYDAAGDSNGLESDNDATGSSNLPQTSAVFSNLTIVGPKSDGALPVGETFEKAFRIRRNSSISIFNSLIVGWEKGLSIEGAAVETNVQNGTLVFANNIMADFETGTNCVTALDQFYSTFFIQNSNDTLTTVVDINWVNPFVSNPDYRLNLNSSVINSADFSNPKLSDQLSVEYLRADDLVVYPNPSNDKIYISGNVDDVKLFDSSGRKILAITSNTIDISNLENGIYLMIVNNSISKSIVKN